MIIDLNVMRIGAIWAFFIKIRVPHQSTRASRLTSRKLCGDARGGGSSSFGGL